MADEGNITGQTASGAAAGWQIGGGWGAVIGGAIGALSGLHGRKKAKKLDRLLAEQITRRAMTQGEIDALIQSEIARMGKATPEAERDAAMSDFVSQLRANRAGRVGSATPATGSSRYAADLSATEQDVGEFAGRESDIASRVASHVRLRDKEALRQGRLKTDFLPIARRMSLQDFYDQLTLARKSRPSWLSGLLGGAGAGIGYGIAGQTPSSGQRQGQPGQVQSQGSRKSPFDIEI